MIRWKQAMRVNELTWVCCSTCATLVFFAIYLSRRRKLLCVWLWVSWLYKTRYTDAFDGFREQNCSAHTCTHIGQISHTHTHTHAQRVELVRANERTQERKSQRASKWVRERKRLVEASKLTEWERLEWDWMPVSEHTHSSESEQAKVNERKFQTFLKWQPPLTLERCFYHFLQNPLINISFLVVNNQKENIQHPQIAPTTHHNIYSTLI